MAVTASRTWAAPRIELSARQTHGFNIRLEIKIFDKSLGLAQKPIELTLQGYEPKTPDERSWYHMSGNLRPIAHWAGAAWEFGMPTMDAYEKPFVVKVDGREIATVRPNIDNRVPQWLDQEIQKIQVGFDPAVFSGSTFPPHKISDDALVKRLLGDYEITEVVFVDSEGNTVQRPGNPGRYGAVVTLKAASGKEIKSYKTLFRMDSKSQLPNAVASKEGIRTALDSGDKSHRTAGMIAAAMERFDGVDAYLSPDNDARRDKRWWMKTRARVLGETLPAFYLYRPHLPPDYDKDKTRLWPMVLYLHGGGLGDANAYLARGALGFMFGGKGPEKFVKISPFCYNGDWDNNHLIDFLDVIECQFRVDHNKIFIVGHSAGGYAVIHFAKAFPSRFAGLVPCAAGGQSIIGGQAQLLKDNNVAVWLFCGELDGRPLAGADVSFQSLMNVGANARYSRLPGHGHGCDHFAIRGGCPELYEWMLTLDKRRPAVHPGDTEKGQWIARDRTRVLDGPKSDNSWQTNVGGAAVPAGYKWYEVYHKLEPPPLKEVIREAKKKKREAGTIRIREADREVRAWRSRSGQRVKAALMEVSGGKAILLLDSGKRVAIPMSRLSNEDQAYIKERLAGE